MHLILQNSGLIAKGASKYACLALCVAMGLFAQAYAGGVRGNSFAPAEPRRPVDDGKLTDEDSKEALQQTLNLNFSPEHREKIRRALEDYARTADPSHDQIEERRREMQQSIENRFFNADINNDGTLDRQEATEKLPQIARHFSSVDTNQDDVISLTELEDAQAKILERRKAADTALEAERQQRLMADSEIIVPAASKRKNKQAINNNKKKAL